MAWHDVIVVGGGPGGSTAAWQLARRGLQPLVLEAREFPRVKLCAGWVTPPVWDELELNPDEYPLTLQAFSQVRLNEQGRTRESRWPGTVGYGIVRREFDQFLLERAVASGARVRFGERIQRVEPVEGGLRLVGQNGEYLARVVIGAGGTHCPVARQFAPKSDDSLVVALEAETRLSADQLREWTPHFGVPELAVEPDFLGYGWYFTKGDYLNIGIGAIRNGVSVRDRLERYREQLVAAGRIPEGVELEPFRGHSYYVATHDAPLAGEHHLLVGDAAGLARPISGEGIGPAIHSGKIAAGVILDHLQEGQSLRDYEQLLRRESHTRGKWVVQTVGALCPPAMIGGLARAVCRIPALRKRWLFEGCFGMRQGVSA